MRITVIIPSIEFSNQVYSSLDSLEKFSNTLSGDDLRELEVILKLSSAEMGEVIKGLKRRYEASFFSCIRVICKADSGLYEGLNQALKEVRGDYFGVLPAGDELVSSALLETIYANKTKYLVYYSDLIYGSGSKILRYWKGGEFNKGELAYGWMPPHPTFYVSTSFFEFDFYKFNTKYDISADYDYMSRCLLNVDRIFVCYVPEVTVIMEPGGMSNGSLKSIFKKMVEDYKIIKANSLGFPVLTLLCKNFRKVSQFF